MLRKLTLVTTFPFFRSYKYEYANSRKKERFTSCNHAKKIKNDSHRVGANEIGLFVTIVLPRGKELLRASWMLQLAEGDT